MSKWLLVNKETKTFHKDGMCDDATKHLWSIGTDQIWLEVPEDVAPGNCKVLDTLGVLSLVDGSADKASPQWAALRAARNIKLFECDYTQLADCSLNNAKIAEFKVYRQALKDLPANTVDPDSVIWPTQP